MLSGQDFKSIDDFKTQFKKAVMLCAIGYPAVNGAGYIQEILTSDNMTAAGIEHSKYSSRTASQKKQINEGLVKKVFDDISDLEKEINKAVGSGPVVGTTGGSSSRPSSSSSNNYPMPSVNTNTVTKQNQIMTFNDITDEHWAYKYIYALKEIGIVNGVDEQRFEPDGLVTREQFVKMLCDAFKLTAAEGSNDASYTDCVKGAWYEDYIQIATSQGIVGGTGDGLFGIGKPVTREDLCVMAVRALNDSAVYENAGFSDSSEIAEYAKSAVSALSAMKVISGFEDGSVRPKESCTRAQAAKIIYELKSIKEIRQ